MLLLDLNSGDGRPIYGQIADRVKFAVAGGVLRAGELVPSVRELSKQLVVNPNTVARAYRDLQSEGLLESVRGMGLQVAEGAAERCRVERREIVRQRLRRAIEEARQSSMDPAEIEAILREEWARGGNRATVRARRRRSNLVAASRSGPRTEEGGHSMIESQAQTGVAIAIEGLTKRFGRQTAVDGLSLSIPQGSIFSLIGENGAGKTTTIQMLLGLLKPTSGRLDVLGLDPAENGLDVRRRVGYVPEVPVLYDWMTVSEIGWFAAGFHLDSEGSASGYQYRYNELIRGFELPARKKIKTLSKGMRAKVSLSLALASDPELLILDEPTSGLDVLVRRDFLESMVDLAGAGRTVLLSSHQIGEVERVASHIAILHRGKLMLAEPLDDLKARTFLLSVTFASRDHPSAPPEGRTLELIDCLGRPAAGALAGARRRPGGLRESSGRFRGSNRSRSKRRASRKSTSVTCGRGGLSRRLPWQSTWRDCDLRARSRC